MGGIAVQGAVGSLGEKATTELTYAFNSMATINGVALGASSSGLFKLNSGTQDDGEDFTRSFTLATTDFGIHNPKKVRYLYVGIKTDNIFTVLTRVDEGDWRLWPTKPPKKGLHGVRVPIGLSSQGRYWTVKISSKYHFRVAEIKVLPIIRNSGIVGY